MPWAKYLSVTGCRVYCRAVTRSGVGTAVQVVAGGVSGLTAIALILGVAVAHLTTSTRESTAVVIAAVTIAGAFVGGFVAAPYFSRLNGKGIRNPHGEGSSRLS